jgi:hypothetical protein
MFDEMFPHYLLMGMTPEQYWDGEYGLKQAYRKSYQMRMENEQKLADRNNWYMGQYMICVLQCVPLLVGGLNVKSSTRLPEYPDRPFFDKIEAERKEEDRRKREEDQMKLAMAMFQSVVMQKNKTIESKPKPGSAGQ